MRLRLSMLLIAAVLIGSGCVPARSASSASGTAAGASSVSVALDWLPNTNHLGLYVALQQGWYAEEGIDVRILPFTDGSQTDVLVAAGQADFAYSFEEAVTQARAADRPVVSVAAVIQKNSSAFVTLRDSGLDRPARLAGKRFAGYGAPFEEPVIEQVLKADGAASGRVQNITTSVLGLDAVLAKQADFAWVFMGWEGIITRRQGVALNTFSPTDYGVPDYYTPVIIANERLPRERPELGRRFMRATARGYEYAIANPAAAAELLLQASPPGTFPDPGVVRESARYLAPRFKEGRARWGEQDLQVWTDYPRFMIRSGRLQDANGQTVTSDLDFQRFFTNELLP